MIPDDRCTKCKGQRKVEPDQVGMTWRVCPRCQANPCLNDEERLARKLGLMTAEVTKERKVVKEYDWFKISIAAGFLILVGFLLTVDVNLSSEVTQTMMALFVMMLPLIIIVGVLSYVMKMFRRSI